MHVHCLNEDVLCIIFQHLAVEDCLSCSWTCRRWRFVLQQLFWPTITSIDLTQSFRLSHTNITGLLDGGLFKCILRQVGAHLRRFTALMTTSTSRRCFAARLEMTQPVMLEIVNNCTWLTEFSVSGFVFRSFECFSCLRLLPGTMTTILVERCRLDHCGPSADSINTLFKEMLATFARLQRFSVRGSCYGCWLMTQEALDTRLPADLRTLDLAENYTAKILHLNWTTNLPHLTELHLERATIYNHDLNTLVASCPNLEKLTLAYCSSVRDFSNLALLGRLRYLVLNGNRDHLHDQALIAICSGCPSMDTLSLESCNGLSPNGLMAIANLHSLRYLNVTSVQTFDDKCLRAICQACHSLTNLQIKYCRRLSSTGLQGILNLSNLRQLGASGLKEFHFEILLALQQRFSNFLQLEIENCPLLTSSQQVGPSAPSV